MYGAGHKATTLLHWLGLNNPDIHYAFDQDIHKQGCVLPNLKISINDVVVLLAHGNDGPISVLNMAIDHREEVDKFLTEHLTSGSQMISLSLNSVLSALHRADYSFF